MKKIPTFFYYLPESSIFFKVRFIPKVLIFFALSIFALFSSNFYLQLALGFIILIQLFTIGFVKHRKKQVYLIFSAIILFSVLWISFSRVGGNLIYFSLPWGTYVSDKTFLFMIIAISKWFLIAISGLLFIATSSEDELIKTLYLLRIPEKAILTVSIAFNTLIFSIKDIETVEFALKSRNLRFLRIISKIKKIYIVGNVLLLNNIRRIETLTESYMLRK